LQLRDLISVAPRYARSINLDRDSTSGQALNGYILTSTARDVLERVLDSMVSDVAHRAWTLTGPYGSGKSAFALFLSSLLSPATDEAGVKARALLKRQHSGLHSIFIARRSGKQLPEFGCCVVNICGSQEPMLPALLDACCKAFGRYLRRGSAASSFAQLLALRESSRLGETVPTRRTVDLLSAISRQLVTEAKAAGVIIIIDELGKFLEHAASSSDNSEVFLLQQLAEATAPSAGNSLALVTVLHQSFERYASALRSSVREEWAKIQGRFEDVAFQEPPDQMLSLIASALQQQTHPIVERLRNQAGASAGELFRLGLAPRGMPREDFIELAKRCAPIHPLAVLVLARLCRKLGQNQRSLFSFLVSREPHGFAEFLERDVDEKAAVCFALPELYDYVSESLGEALTVGESGTKWAAAQSALDRAIDCSAEEMNLLKCVGLLSAMGAHGELRPSVEVLKQAIDLGAKDDFSALRNLIARSFLIERKYNGTVGLWEGSDIDLDEKVIEAAKRLPETSAIAAKVASYHSPRPMIAKRHSYLTGTLRYFDVTFSDISTFTRSLKPSEDADGLLVFCLPADSLDFENLEKLAIERSRECPELVIALPRDVESLSETIRQMELLHWVEANTPELQSDAVARREIRGRLAWMGNRLAAEIQRLFHPGEQAAQSTRWIFDGKSVSVASARGFSSLLSTACDQLYPQTPTVRNELINRRYLSSSAAAARRNLIAAMISKRAVHRLGFEGNPPEVRMYRSLLEESGIHRKHESSYHFQQPHRSNSLLAVWKRIDQFLEDTVEAKRSVGELFDLLQAPPYGMKMGVLPVLFCAYVLANDTEVALYDDGVFTPELSVEAMERLLRSPHRFEVRRYRIAGVRREVFTQIGTILGAPMAADRTNLIELMRPLYKFFQRLPAYTRQTKRLPEKSAAVRQALADAREPDVLLFSDLPMACGCARFTTEDANSSNLATFLQSFRQTLVDLHKTYDELLQDLQDMLSRSLGVSGAQARATLRLQANDVFAYAVEPRLRAFTNNLADDHLQDKQWIEAVATMVVGKVPRSWNDTDRAKYEVTLTELSRSFRHTLVLVEERSTHQQRAGQAVDVTRYSVHDLRLGETEEVISLAPRERKLVDDLTVSLESIVEARPDAADPKVTAAALGQVLKKYLLLMKEPHVEENPAMISVRSRHE